MASIVIFKMESKANILRKPTEEGNLQKKFRGRRKLPHKTLEKLDELTRFDCPAIFLPTKVSSAAYLLSWSLTKLLEA